MLTFRFLLFALLLFFIGCIGTDEVDFPLGQDQSSLTINRASLAMALGGSEQLNAQYTDFNGNPADVNLTWMSEDESIAIVSNDGLVTAISVGQTTISVLAANGAMATALVTIVADNSSIATIQLQAAKSTLELNEMQKLTPVAMNVEGAQLAINSPITWESSDVNTVSVDTEGNVTALAAGSSDIACTIEGIRSEPFVIMVNSGDRSGTFSGLNGYNVSGSATVSGTEIVLGSDFSTSNGPGLYVYLSNSPTSVSNGVEIAKLQSNQGMQNYPLASSVNVSAYSHVIIYCKPFGASFGAALVQ